MIGSWWRHVWHTVGLLGAIGGIVAVLWLAASLKNRIDRGRELLQAAQPVTVAAAAPVLSPGELAARYNLVPAALSKAPTVDQAALRKAAAAGAAAALAAQQKGAHPGQSQPAPEGAAPKPGAPGPPGALPPAAACIPLPAAGSQFYYPEKKITAGQARWGATALPLLNPDNTLELLVKGDPRPRFQLGGLSRAGVAWDPVARTFGGFVEHDFLSLGLGTEAACKAKSWRCGRALVLGARPFASYGYQALPGAKTTDYGVPVTLAVDF
jgi:hypothetical protein